MQLITISGKLSGVWGIADASGAVRPWRLEYDDRHYARRQRGHRAAILAAAKTLYGSLCEAAEAMNTVALRVEPQCEE